MLQCNKFVPTLGLASVGLERASTFEARCGGIRLQNRGLAKRRGGLQQSSRTQLKTGDGATLDSDEADKAPGPIDAAPGSGTPLPPAAQTAERMRGGGRGTDDPKSEPERKGEEADPPASNTKTDQTPRSSSEGTEYRATPEDYLLWGVIAGVLGYLAWHLHSESDGLRALTDVERLSLYGMNVRANLLLLIGAVIALVGCMIVLRRVRTDFSGTAAVEGARARVVADSAGLVIVVLGVLLLAIVATHPPHFEHMPTGGFASSRPETAAPPGLGVQGALQELRKQQERDQAPMQHGRGGEP